MDSTRNVRNIGNIGNEFSRSIMEAERSLLSSEHLLKVILPVVKDQKMLLRVLENLNKSAISILSLILKYEHIYGKIELSKDSKDNLNTFFGKCSSSYGVSDTDGQSIKRILFLARKYKESGFEFSRRDKVIIMDDSLNTNEVTKSELEEATFILRKLVKNARLNFVAFKRKI